jgi:hypothetical protein
LISSENPWKTLGIVCKTLGFSLEFLGIPLISFSESSLFNGLRRPLGRNLLWGPSRRQEHATNVINDSSRRRGGGRRCGKKALAVDRVIHNKNQNNDILDFQQENSQESFYTTRRWRD